VLTLLLAHILSGKVAASDICVLGMHSGIAVLVLLRDLPTIFIDLGSDPCFFCLGCFSHFSVLLWHSIDLELLATELCLNTGKYNVSQLIREGLFSYNNIETTELH